MDAQNPPSDGDGAVTQPTDFHWAVPKISTPEKYFLSQLIASPSKDVRMLVKLQVDLGAVSAFLS